MPNTEFIISFITCCMGVIVLGFIILLGTFLILRKTSKNKEENSKPLTPDDFPNNSAPSVISLNVKNHTDKIKNVKIFGFNRFYNAVNYGSDVGVEITSAYMGTLYSEVICESADGYAFSCMRLLSENVQQLKMVMRVKENKGNGSGMEYPICCAEYHDKQMLNGAMHDTILDIKESFTIKGSSWLEFEILPKTNLSMNFFQQK